MHGTAKGAYISRVAGGTRVTLEHRGLDALPPEVAEARRRSPGWGYAMAWFAAHIRQQAA